MTRRAADGHSNDDDAAIGQPLRQLRQLAAAWSSPC